MIQLPVLVSLKGFNTNNRWFHQRLIIGTETQH